MNEHQLDAQSILMIGGSVTALTQLAKAFGVPKKFGPLLVLALAAIGEWLFAWSRGDLSRAAAWDYFAGWITISTTAAGVYGFVVSASDAIKPGASPGDKM